MSKKIFVILLAAMITLLATACENPNASKSDKVGSYAASAYVERADM